MWISGWGKTLIHKMWMKRHFFLPLPKKKTISTAVSGSVHKPTAAVAANGDGQEIALCTSNLKSYTTFLRSALCQLSFLYWSGTSNMPIKVSK